VPETAIDVSAEGEIAPFTKVRSSFSEHTAAFLPGHDPELVVFLHLARRAGNLINSLQQRVLREHGLDNGSFSVLVTLANDPSPHALPLGEIAPRVVQTPSGVTRTVHRLVAQRLVKRTIDPYDGRVMQIQLTAKGKSVARAALADIVTQFRESLGSPTADESRHLADLQVELSDVLERLVQPNG
jgi:DNA-binding MarR family transcriptional regulator